MAGTEARPTNRIKVVGRPSLAANQRNSKDYVFLQRSRAALIEVRIDNIIVGAQLLRP